MHDALEIIGAVRQLQPVIPADGLLFVDHAPESRYQLLPRVQGQQVEYVLSQEELLLQKPKRSLCVSMSMQTPSCETNSIVSAVIRRILRAFCG